MHVCSLHLDEHNIVWLCECQLSLWQLCQVFRSVLLSSEVLMWSSRIFHWGSTTPEITPCRRWQLSNFSSCDSGQLIYWVQVMSSVQFDTVHINIYIRPLPPFRHVSHWVGEVHCSIIYTLCTHNVGCQPSTPLIRSMYMTRIRHVDGR